MGIGDLANNALVSTIIGGLAVTAISGLLGLLTKRGRHWLKAATHWVVAKRANLRAFVVDWWKRRQRPSPSETSQHADPPVEPGSGSKPLSDPAPRRPINVPILSEREVRLLTAQHRNASRVRLELVRESDEFWASWTLKNWGPGDAYALYVTPKSSDFKLDQELWDELRAKQQIPLFQHWPYIGLGLYRTGSPQIRVEYTDSQGEEHVEFVDVPLEARR